MAAEVEPKLDHRVLEIGTGSGYGAAVLAQVTAEVYTVERHRSLADQARARLARLGIDNVTVLHGDGTRGWAAHAPYDGIVVTAGATAVPGALRRQLKVGGVLIIPVGEHPPSQTLLKIRRTGEDSFSEEDLGGVSFVPLVGEEGGEAPDPEPNACPGRTGGGPASQDATSRVISAAAEPFEDPDSADLEPMLRRIGEARLVLLGEATHGTAEFYRMRARITRELIERKGFDLVAVEADWPDAQRIDTYVRLLNLPAQPWKAFARFPTWMWRNQEVNAFVEWLRRHNAGVEPDARVGFHGLDLYSMFTSIGAVLDYLQEVDPDTAAAARERYGCLSPWGQEPAHYGHAVVSGRYEGCEQEVMANLKGLLEKRLDYQHHDGLRFLDAVQNARLVANSERYYRAMYYGSADSWNLRDGHMLETLQTLLDFRGPGSKAVVWAHNSHVGNAAATEMGAHGETNVGELCRRDYGSAAVLVGLGTDRGTVAAADDWDAPMQIKRVRPSHPASYERLCRDTGIGAFVLPLRGGAVGEGSSLRRALSEPRLERAIGVIYRPETERQSHYFHASLPEQFDEYLWLEVTRAVTPLPAAPEPGLPETWPFGL